MDVMRVWAIVSVGAKGFNPATVHARACAAGPDQHAPAIVPLLFECCVNLAMAGHLAAAGKTSRTQIKVAERHTRAAPCRQACCLTVRASLARRSLLR